MTEASGTQEVVVVDRDPSIIKGIERLFAGSMLVTGLQDADRARAQVTARLVPLVLVDLDTPTPGAGVDLLRFIRKNSPLTRTVAMTAQRSFEAAAAAFRAGAIDVVVKTPDQIEYLKQRVLEISDEAKGGVGNEQLLRLLADVHEDFLRKMMDMSKQITDLEERALSRDGGVSSSINNLATIHVLLADDEPGLQAMMEQELSPDHGWYVRYAQSGGEALDAATQNPPHIMVIKESLPDLPGSMVLKSVKAAAPEVVALLFKPPTPGGEGRVKLVEDSTSVSLIPAFNEPSQLIKSLVEIRDALRRKAREKRYVQAFRRNNMDFLKRYSMVKQQLDKLLNPKTDE